ncbi:MAG: Lrp/AsnC family transcriptional regulator [SAR202 cluster bacterium]|nr:Lrp/AsnC family transcriptional regulator [SAR202 cluster bacterium]
MATRTPAMDLTDRQLLNVLQSDFPLAEEPYKVLGARLELTEGEVIERIARLKKRNVVRQVSAIFDTRRLGYETCLVAFRYPPELLNKGAYRVNKHPGVSHNYARNGYFNLWFTIAVPPDDDLQSTVERLARETGAIAARVMPTIRFFKIGVNFDMVAEKGAAYDYYSPDGFAKQAAPKGGVKGLNEQWNKAEALTPFEIDVIRELQEDLPLEGRPFDAMAARLGLSVTELFDQAAAFQRRGIMRRYSAVLYHRKAGFSHNAMAVWKVPEERAVEVGLTMAESPWVTHCYQRPTFPDWEYTHFTMIHAPTKEQCEQVAGDIARQTGIADYQLLYSTREYKKTRVRYFVEHEAKV